jgi:hypothetical protein
MTWLYNRTNGSLLAPALFHPAMNTFEINIPNSHITLYLLVALVIFAILFDQMWKKLPSDHPAMVNKTFAVQINKSKLDETLEVSNV